MVKSKENQAGAPAEAPAKKLRRGINNETKAVANLKFHEKDAAQNGLFIGHLEEVTVDWSTNADSKSFTGLRVPRLTYHFESNHTNVNERRHVYQTLFPVESSVDTIPNGKEEWKVNNVLNWIKHLLDVFYLKGRQLTQEEENLLALPFNDFDENGEYVPIDPQEVANGYGALFTNVVSLMNGSFNLADGETAHPCYKDANGKAYSIWMKLLRHKRRKNDWVNIVQNGDLGFDQFIGSGAIEIQKPNTPPAILRLDLAKESITPKETKKQPTIGMPGSTMGSVIAGMPTDGIMNGGVNTAYNEAGSEDMPF
ncbi:MAG: hypothetical protein J6Y28_09890 [Acholeplasmatales bacterium]|nr:hypothetical protein [Methanobrevibacter sp.]MBP5446470.1 hypothetical protein [Acholeplasmatales bacterium]